MPVPPGLSEVPGRPGRKFLLYLRNSLENTFGRQRHPRVHLASPLHVAAAVFPLDAAFTALAAEAVSDRRAAPFLDLARISQAAPVLQVREECGLPALLHIPSPVSRKPKLSSSAYSECSVDQCLRYPLDPVESGDPSPPVIHNR